jgi:hypothetical protein
MLNPYHERLDIQGILKLQNHQHQAALYLEQLIPAASQTDAAVQVSGAGHFMLLTMTGAYSTIEAEDADNGLCMIYVQLVDGTNNRALFDDFAWAGLFMSPGRFKLLPAVGAASNQLMLEYPFIYTFPINGQILVRIRNESDQANYVKMLFKGIRIFPQSRQNA